MTSLEPAPMRWTLAARVRVALAAAGVLVFFTGLDNYAYRFWSLPAPVYLVWFFVAAAAVLLVLDLHGSMPFARSPVLAWTFAFLLLTSAWAVLTVSSPFESLAMRAYYRSMALLAAFIVIFGDARARRAATLTVGVAVLFASCLNVAELSGAVQFVGQEDIRVAGRAAGLYINANAAGLAMVFGLAIAIGTVPRLWRLPLLVAATFGVATTFSRGAAMCLALLIPLLVWRKQVRGWAVACVWVLLTVLVLVQGGRAIRFLDARGVLTADTSARLELEQDDSGRTALARGAWRAFLDEPLVGNGVGTTREAHNQFLTLAGDHGILGLLLFPALALAIAWSNPGAVPFALILLMAGFFSHNLLDDRASLLAIALAAAAGARTAAWRAPSLAPAAPDAGGVPVGR